MLQQLLGPDRQLRGERQAHRRGFECGSGEHVRQPGAVEPRPGADLPPRARHGRAQCPQRREEGQDQSAFGQDQGHAQQRLAGVLHVLRRPRKVAALGVRSLRLRPQGHQWARQVAFPPEGLRGIAAGLLSYAAVHRDLVPQLGALRAFVYQSAVHARDPVFGAGGRSGAHADGLRGPLFFGRGTAPRRPDLPQGGRRPVGSVGAAHARGHVCSESVVRRGECW
mmetsp:Transcript_63918/g.195478  ORF Transcript_63918/g.195478 Transcript_63918/m.195478 type:complete len:224 (-) Transcript_63918:1029-1700(-)